MLQIVVVEADATVARLYREELEDEGFGVRVFSDSVQALAELRDKPAHVVITEPSSVRGDLHSWLGRLRSLHKGGVVVLDRPPRRTVALPALSFVPKSADLGPLIQSVRGQANKAVWLQFANC